MANQQNQNTFDSASFEEKVVGGRIKLNSIKFQCMVNDNSLRLEDRAAQSMAIAEHKEVEVVICQPGDSMIFRPYDAHSVFTVFP